MRAFISLYLVLIFLNSSSQDNFNENFTGHRLRFDYTLKADSREKVVTTESFQMELVWAGTRNNLVDSFYYGEMRVELFDSATGTLIYSSGFTTLYNEWETLERNSSEELCFRESLVMPFPRKNTLLVISEREADQTFREIHREIIEPEKYILAEDKKDDSIEFQKLTGNKEIDKALDIVFISEGYTIAEKEKFFNDARKFAASFTRWNPYANRTELLNISALFVPSVESGVTDPCDSIYLNTAFQMSFNTLGMDRYLMSSSISLIRDRLKFVAYDQICMMVNTDKYGGGGIYNYLTVFTSGHTNSEFLLQHELAHTLAGLADEYYTSQVTYSNIFPTEYEPYQPNITTLVDFESKWKHLVNDTIPVPTPNQRQYNNVVGVFEGAGYSAEGIFRPYYNCTMKSSKAAGFCPVCEAAISEMLDYYSE